MLHRNAVHICTTHFVMMCTRNFCNVFVEQFVQFCIHESKVLFQSYCVITDCRVINVILSKQEGV